jgi:hypothetical protein
MQLDVHHQIALKTIGRAHSILSGNFSAHSNLSHLICEESLQYLKQKKIYGLGTIGTPGDDPQLYAFDRLWQLQRSAVSEIANEFAARGIALISYKGHEVNIRHGLSVPFTIRGDVDLLLLESDVPRAKATMAELGYVQAFFNVEKRSLVPLSRDVIDDQEQGQYVLFSFAKLVNVQLPIGIASRLETQHPFYVDGENLTVIIAIDLAMGLDRSWSTEKLLPDSIGGPYAHVRSISLERHLWYLCVMFYLGANMQRDKLKLSGLADISLFVTNASKQLNWNLLIREATDLDVLPSVYYTLALLNKLIPTHPIPDEVITELRPIQGSRARDYGWQIHKVLGIVEPIPSDLF